MSAISRLRRSTFAAACLTGCLLLLPACKGKEWVLGSWLLIDDNGKPGACHTFNKDHTLTVYTGAACKGPKDDMVSGKWQLKAETKLAIQRGQEKVAHLALITDRNKERAVSRGNIPGTLYRVGKAGGEALLQALLKKGVVKVRPLPPAMGCAALGRALAKVRALPKELKTKVRMLRQRDAGLEYRLDASTGDAKLAKIIWALNQDQLDWVYLELTEAAFAAPGPEARFEDALGKPHINVSTGKGEKRQSIVMWKTYCSELRGQRNKDIDVTLFSTAGKKQAYFYISEGVLSNIWEDLRKAASDPAAQATDDDDATKDGKAKDGKTTKKTAKTAKTPTPKAVAKTPVAKTPLAKTPAAKSPKAATPKKAGKPKAGKAGVTSSGRPVVSGKDEDI